MNNIKIYSQNNEGAGICKIDGITTFVPYTVSGDIVNIKLIKNHKNFNEGILDSIITKSNERQDAICPYYYECGGCNLMHQSYKYQLEFKKNKVINNLQHISNIKIDNIDIEYDKEIYYRNHIILNVKNNLLGFYKKQTNEIIDINKCIISNEKINKTIIKLKEFINKYKDNNITKISIKSYKEILINITCSCFKYLNEFKSIVKYDSLYINDIYIDGIKSVEEELKDKRYKISSTSFFQKNTNMTIKLYDYIKSIIDNVNVLDLYCGTGSIGIYIADKCKSVVGVEIIDEAVNDAIENARINNIKNISFKRGKVEDNISNIKDIDTIIVDPPRIGLNKKAISDIIDINPNKIIYVSCNSTTLARDINLLKDKYKLKSIKLFDLFPNTHHVECVCDFIKE